MGPVSKPPLLARLFKAKRFRRDDDALVNLGRILGIAGVIIGAVVSIILIAALGDDFLNATADITGVFNDAGTTTGDTTADGLLPVFGMLVAFAGLFALVGLVFVAIKLRKG